MRFWSIFFDNSIKRHLVTLLAENNNNLIVYAKYSII